MKPLNDMDLKYDWLTKFLREFQSESDRGAAIFGASMLDQMLKNIILDFLIPGKHIDDLVNRANAPLGTFSARLNCCLALGLIEQFEFDDANNVRKIRNDFAHKFETEFSFENKKIKSLCQNFKAHTPGPIEEFKDKPRFLFTNAVTLLYLRLVYRGDWIKLNGISRPNLSTVEWIDGTLTIGVKK